MLTIRAVQWPHDAAILFELDTAFETEHIYRPVQEELAFRLEEQAVTPALRKRYVLDVSDAAERQNWDCSLLAQEEGELAGFAAAQYTAWNRRVIVWHLYVMPFFRRRGVGSRLLNALDDYAVSVQGRCLWLETQNVNYAAIQFYLRCGFAFCGFDASLYDSQQSAQEEQEEIALFFSRGVGLPT